MCGDMPAATADMSTAAISRQLAQLGEAMRSELAQRDDELGREREELSFDAVCEIQNDVWPCSHHHHLFQPFLPPVLCWVRARRTLSALRLTFPPCRLGSLKAQGRDRRSRRLRRSSCRCCRRSEQWLGQSRR